MQMVIYENAKSKRIAHISNTFETKMRTELTEDLTTTESKKNNVRNECAHSCVVE